MKYRAGMTRPAAQQSQYAFLVRGAGDCFGAILEVAVTIRLTPPKPDSPTFEVDHQIALALVTLHDAQIRVRGAGRFGRETATILLARNADSDRALEELQKKGIEGLPEPETQVGRGDGDFACQHRGEGTVEYTSREIPVLDQS